MTVRIILAPVTGDQTANLALSSGLNLARRFDAHLQAAHVVPDRRKPLDLPSEVRARLSKSVLEKLEKEAEETAKSTAEMAEKAFRSVCENADVPVLKRPRRRPSLSASWNLHAGDPYHVMSIIGRLADLIVMAQPEHKVDENTGRFIKTSLFETSTPMVYVPKGWKRDVGNRVIIAWDKSAEAMRAVKDSVPLLQAAEDVQIVSIGGTDKVGPNARDVGRYLRWHGVESETHLIKRSRQPVEQTLLKQAEKFDADLLVMGAYSRSRLRERLFGGVTRSMLNQRDLPILLRH